MQAIAADLGTLGHDDDNDKGRLIWTDPSVIPIDSFDNEDYSCESDGSLCSSKEWH